MAIQIEKTKKVKGFKGRKFLIHGEPKIGKTSLANEFPKPLFLATENGHSDLEECSKLTCNSWKAFLDACAIVGKGDHGYETIIVDTADRLAKYCREQVCQDNAMSHPADLPIGKGWSLVTDELDRVIDKLIKLPYTFIFITHSSKENIETNTGRKYVRWNINIGGKNKNVFTDMADVILFITHGKDASGGDIRVLKTQQNPSWEAGGRGNNLEPEIQFKTPKEAFDKIKEQMEG